MVKTNDIHGNFGTIADINYIEREFPLFYATNKEKIDNCDIVLIEENFGLEIGIFLDKTNLETIFFSYK